MNGRIMKTRLLVSGLGKETIILGLPWLRKTNPDINWKKGTLKFRARETETMIRSMTTLERIIPMKAIAAKARQAMKGTTFEQKKKEDKKWPQAMVEELPNEEKLVKTLPDAEPIRPQDEPTLAEEPNSRGLYSPPPIPSGLHSDFLPAN
jgi:hypothetical protein